MSTLFRGRRRTVVERLRRSLRRTSTVYDWCDSTWRSLRAYRRVFGRWPNLRRPRSWNEWIQRAKILERDRRFSIYADKFAVRDVVAQRVGSQVLPQLHLSGTSAEEFRLEGLPERFMLKASHGCKWFLPMVQRDAADAEALRRTIRGWLRQNFWLISGEYRYRSITPRFLVEEWLGNADGSALWDYKFYCFGGRVALVHLDIGRFGQHQRVFFTRDWQFRPIILRGLGYASDAPDLPPPQHFTAMVELAETLSAGHDFLRVDLYEDARGPIFGELTFFPGSGLVAFDDMAIDDELGALWASARCARTGAIGDPQIGYAG